MNKKVCMKCKMEKSLSEFHKNKTKEDGHQDYCKQCRKNWNTEHDDGLKIKRKERYNNDQERFKKEAQDWADNNRERKRASGREYYKDNKEKLIEYQRVYAKERRVKDDLYRLKKNLRCNIKDALTKRGFSKSKKTEEILGCTLMFFIEYVESKFVDGMSWENRDEWHLDHIKPMKLATNQEEAIELNRYTNFQPLWIADNLKKRAKFDDPIQPKLL